MRFLFSIGLFFLFSSLLIAQVLFVSPVLKDQSRLATPANMTKVDHEGQKVILFQSVEETEDHRKVRQLMESSPMIQFVFDLRRQARNIHQQVAGTYATVDTEETPFLVYFGEKMGKGGPSVASGFRILVEDQGLRSDSLMVLAPLNYRGAEMKIEDFVTQKYFSTLIAHEFFHGIMGDVYGRDMMEIKARSYSRKGHAAHLVTDEYLAFIEGTAEAMELVSQELYSAEVSHKLVDVEGMDPKIKDFVKSFKKRRLVHANRNHFGFKADGKVKDGELDEASVQLKTEGMIATLFYRVLFKSNVDDSFSKVLHVMAQEKPLTLIDFIKSFVSLYPGDRASVIRQFLENTHYMSVDPSASELYKAYYLSKKDYKQKKLPKEDYRKIQKEWQDWKLAKYQAVLSGDLDIDGALKLPYIVADEDMFYEVDLNSADQFDLTDFFDEYFSSEFGEEEIQNMITVLLRMREKGKFVKDMDSLEFPDSVESGLEKYHNTYVEHMASTIEDRVMQLTEGIYAGFHESHEGSEESILESFIILHEH